MVAYVILKASLPISPNPPYHGNLTQSARASLRRACKKKRVSGPPSLSRRRSGVVVPQDLQIRFKTQRFSHLRRSSFGHWKTVNPGPAVQPQEFNFMNPSPGIQAQSKPRNPIPGIQSQASRPRDPNTGKRPKMIRSKCK